MMFLLAAIAPALAGEPDSVELLIRTQIKAPNVVFDTKTRAWLDTNPVVKIAYSEGSLPPLYMGFEADKIEGVTTDTLGIIRQSTGLTLKLLRYPSRAAENQALENGEVDMIALHDVSEGLRGVQTQTRPYLMNHKVIVRRIAKPKTLPQDFKGQRLAFVGDNEVAGQLHKQYPDAVLTQYSSYLNALLSLIYNEADALYSNSITAEFYMRRLNSNAIYIASDATPTSADFNFAVSNRKPQLLAAINSTLDATPISDMINIASRWGLDSNFVINQHPLELTPVEAQWIAEHPKIKVLVAGSFAPLTFFGERNRFQGLGADVLKLIENRTGLQMDIVRDDSIDSQLEKLNNRQANLMAVLNIGNELINADQYTRPYLISPFLLITRSADVGMLSLDELNGRRLAVPRINPLLTWLDDHQPLIHKAIVTNPLIGIEQLSNNDVDGTVLTQFDADYLIQHYFKKNLHVAMVVRAKPAQVAMAVSRDDLPLKSIINKILLETPPEDLKSMSDHWQNQAGSTITDSWSTYKNQVYNIVMAAILFVLVFIILNYYLNHQIRSRQKAERKLGDQLEFTRTLIEEIPVAVYVRDKDARLIQCNKAYTDVLQTPREELIGTTLLQLSVLIPEQAREFHRIYLEAMEHGRATFGDQNLHIKNQVYRVYIWALPFRNSEGNVIGVIGGWLDITERLHLEEQLRQAKKNADEANHSKSVFLANMSHEIRTPISALIGLIELLRLRSSCPKQTEENLSVAHQSAQSLLYLIGDILDLSKIEAGAMVPLPRPTDLNELMRSTHKLFDNNARKKGLTYSLKIAVSYSHVIIDAVMLNQIVTNLLSNAIKFTERGSIELSLKVLPISLENGQQRFRIDVIDTGIGLTPQQRKSIFEPFVQIPSSANTPEGTGLGLSICKRLAKLLGGTLEVDSHPGKGSCFSLEFDAELTEVIEVATLPTVPSHAGYRLNILVVDDHSPNRLLLCQQLDYLGHHAVPCDDGDTALALWEQADPEFDVTITDCNMPRMSGYELTGQMRTIEQNHGQRPHPILGLTANAQAQIVKECLEAGMTHCLFKPIGVGALTEVLDKICQVIVQRTEASKACGGELQKLRALRPDAYGVLVDELVRTHREDATALAQRIQANDLPGLSRLAHKIKGSAQLTNSRTLLQACERLEEFALSGDAPQCRQQIDVLLLAMDALERQLLADL